MKKFLKENRVELIGLLVFAFGIFLLVERFEIRVTILRTIRGLAGLLRSLMGAMSAWIVAYFRTFTISDLIGWILILLTSTFLVWRIRVRFLHSERWRARACPRCGGPLERVHRLRIDHWLGQTLLPHSRRYRCLNSECRWTGLRHHEHKSRREETQTT